MFIEANALKKGESSPINDTKFTLPLPRPDIDEMRRNLWLRFLTSPLTLLNYIKYKLSDRIASPTFTPIKLDIEPVSRCNFHCTMCQVSDFPKFKRAGDMSLPDFKEIIDSQKGLIEVKIQGLGEPLLARDIFFDMIRYARSKYIWVRTTTNGSLLHQHNNFKKLIDSGVNEVQISFDGATKQTFESIRRGSKFEKVVENCLLINNYCKEIKVNKTRMWITMQSHNIHEFFDFIPLAAQMGFSRLTYSLSLHGFGLDNWRDKNDAVNIANTVTDQMVADAVLIGKRLGIEVTFWRETGKFDSDKKTALCPWPFERNYISSDMKIVPCCMIGNPDVLNLGEAKELTSVWNGEIYRKFRQDHIDGNIPKACQMCYTERHRK